MQCGDAGCLETLRALAAVVLHGNRRGRSDSSPPCLSRAGADNLDELWRGWVGTGGGGQRSCRRTASSGRRGGRGGGRTGELDGLADVLALHVVVLVSLDGDDVALDRPAELARDERLELVAGEAEPLGRERERQALVRRGDGAGDDVSADQGGEEGVLGERVVAEDCRRERLSACAVRGASRVGETRRTDGGLVVAVEDGPELGEAARAQDRVELGQERQQQRQLRVLVLVLVGEGDGELPAQRVTAAAASQREGDAATSCQSRPVGPREGTHGTVAGDSHGEVEVGSGCGNERLEQQLEQDVRVEERRVELVAGGRRRSQVGNAWSPTRSPSAGNDKHSAAGQAGRTHSFNVAMLARKSYVPRLTWSYR